MTRRSRSGSEVISMVGSRPSSSRSWRRGRSQVQTWASRSCLSDDWRAAADPCRLASADEVVVAGAHAARRAVAARRRRPRPAMHPRRRRPRTSCRPARARRRGPHHVGVERLDSRPRCRRRQDHGRAGGAASRARRGDDRHLSLRGRRRPRGRPADRRARPRRSASGCRARPRTVLERGELGGDQCMEPEGQHSVRRGRLQRQLRRRRSGTLPSACSLPVAASRVVTDHPRATTSVE